MSDSCITVYNDIFDFEIFFTRIPFYFSAFLKYTLKQKYKHLTTGNISQTVCVCVCVCVCVYTHLSQTYISIIYIE